MKVKDARVDDFKTKTSKQTEGTDRSRPFQKELLYGIPCQRVKESTNRRRCAGEAESPRYCWWDIKAKSYTQGSPFKPC